MTCFDPKSWSISCIFFWSSIRERHFSTVPITLKACVLNWLLYCKSSFDIPLKGIKTSWTSGWVSNNLKNYINWILSNLIKRNPETYTLGYCTDVYYINIPQTARHVPKLCQRIQIGNLLSVDKVHYVERDFQTLSFCTFSFGHCVVCSSSIYRLWLPFWYLLAIVLSVLLRYADYDCPFGLFKLFLQCY